VFSARFGGEGADDAERCRQLLDQLGKTPRRDAAFVCVLSLAVPTGPALTYEGRCEGRIAPAPSGSNGFGYDPVFYFPPLGQTFAEMTREEKGRVSHRGAALRELREEFEKVLIWIEQQMPAMEKHEHAWDRDDFGTDSQ
jgi:XTP/dITP diphosphohydrolase